MLFWLLFLRFNFKHYAAWNTLFPLNYAVATSKEELKIQGELSKHTVTNFQFYCKKVLIMKERREFSVIFLWQPFKNNNLIFDHEIRQNIT